MAEMTMLSMAVMAANKRGRSLSEATAGRKDLYLVEGSAEEADAIYLPDHSSLDFRQTRKLLTVGKHVLFGAMGAVDASSLNVLAQTTAGHGAVLLDHIHLAFNPCMISLKIALICLGLTYRVRLYPYGYVSCCKGVCTVPVCLFTHIPQGGTLFQRGYDCIYPFVYLFGIPEQLDIQMIFTENRVDAAGAVKGTLGSVQVGIAYSKTSGSHIPGLIEGEGGRPLIRDLRNLRGVTYFNCSSVEKPTVSFSEEACCARELDRSMAFVKGNCDRRLQLASSLQALQMVDEIRGDKKMKDLVFSWKIL